MGNPHLNMLNALSIAPSSLSQNFRTNTYTAIVISIGMMAPIMVPNDGTIDTKPSMTEVSSVQFTGSAADAELTRSETAYSDIADIQANVRFPCMRGKRCVGLLLVDVVESLI